ncbi:MAG: CoA-binding protein [Candidatus Methanomethylicaceae archaeon]|nr:CoA-binding protein [Candidatus Verstraetearchaeota archaeon]
MQELQQLFKPKSIAIIGASNNPRKIGHEIMKNIIISGYEGKIYPINLEGKDVLGFKSYTSILSISDEIDLAIIAIPASFVIDVLEECGRKGVKAVIVISSGFKEIGNIELEEKLLSIVKKYGMRILGPNVFGIYYAPSKLNATFGPSRIHPGKIAFITQSGALGIALMEWATLHKIGLSTVVSMGNKADIDEADILDYLSNDNETKAVIIYMEGVKDGRKLMKSLINITLKKPVIIIKSGRSNVGAIAAASHTGSMAGSDIVYTTAFKQSGALRADDLLQAFDWAKLMVMQPPPKNKDCVILTNGGGIGVLAADACEKEDLNLPILPQDLQNELKKIMPIFGSSRNPIDLTGQAGEEEYFNSLRILMKDDRVSSIVLLYCQTAITDPIEISNAILNVYREFDTKKPIVVSFLGGEKCEEAMKKLEENSIPTYEIPERAISSLAAYYKWYKRKINPTISY